MRVSKRENAVNVIKRKKVNINKLILLKSTFLILFNKFIHLSVIDSIIINK
jgi:hypothetical protein